MGSELWTTLELSYNSKNRIFTSLIYEDLLFNKGLIFSNRDMLLSLQEPQIKRHEHQDNSYVDGQPFPESVSEKHKIYTDYYGDHHDNADHIYPQGIFFHNFSIALKSSNHMMGIKNNPISCGLFFILAPRAGIEPATVSLTASRSTAELPGNDLYSFSGSEAIIATGEYLFYIHKLREFFKRGIARWKFTCSQSPPREMTPK